MDPLMPRSLLFRFLVWSAMPVVTLGSAAALAVGPTVQVQVATTDADGDALHYAWKATDGSVANVNAASTTWTLPDGPGLHFVYVQVSDGKGGTIERRLALNTDVIGTPIPVSPPVTIAPPLPAAAGEVFWHIIYNIGWDDRRYYDPDVSVVLQEATSRQSYATSTDLKGFFLSPKLPTGTYNLLFMDQYGATNSSTDITQVVVPQPVSGPYPVSYDGNDPYSSVDQSSGLTPDRSFSPWQTFMGHVELADGTPCGAQSPFFVTESTATVALLGAGATPLAGPVRVNARGDYWLAADLTGTSQVTLRVSCEGAPVVDEPVAIEMRPAGETNAYLTRNFTLANHAPAISTMTATRGGSPVGIFLPPPSGLPSDRVAAPDTFLAFKGLDSRTGACQYYRAIGVVQGCNASGTPTGAALRFDDWKRIHQMAPYNGTNTEYSAVYINKVDLNLTRYQHGTVVGTDHVAAYVCNHLGPTDALGRPVEDQASVDAAIDNAVNGKNLVACVAFDYSVTPGVNNNLPFTKYITFGPSGELLLSVNLDGRAEKFMPGVCVACHGGDKYHVRYPDDGTGDADIGAHFLPYDLGNFEFSSKPGLTEVDQQASLHQLNQMVLGTGPTAATSALISGWYAGGGDAPDKAYVPASWQAGTPGDIDFYKRVIASNCRTCHVAMDPQFNFDDYATFRAQNWKYEAVCDGPSLQRAHSMPNALVTFNRFWGSVGTADDQPKAYVDELYAMWGRPGTRDTCRKAFLPDGVFQWTRRNDFSGSTRSALLLQKGGRLKAWFMKPDGFTKSSAGGIINLTGTTRVYLASGDFDGDGKADMLLQDGGKFIVRLLNGRSLKAEGQIANFGASGKGFAGVGDFDGDGKDDIVWRAGDVYSIALLNGLSVKSTKNVANQTGTGTVLAAVGDFNGDAMSDLLWRQGDVYTIWMMTGQTLASSRQIADFTGTGWALAGVGRFYSWAYGILWENLGRYSMWSLNSNLIPVSKKTIANFSTSGWAFAGTGDLNGDGYTDILWRKGDVYQAWLMLDYTRIAARTVANLTGTGWHIVP